MGDPSPPAPSMLLVAVFSRHEDALAWARDRAARHWGAPLLESEPFDFHETDYYAATMGRPLKKQFFAFPPPFDPAGLVQIKLATNAWEQEYATAGSHSEPRPLNIDPGYLGLGKLVLASTKDFTHRIYLGGGIYAEVTLNFRRGRWEHHEWTFPDYRRGDYHQFFSTCRDALRRYAREGRLT